MKKTGRGVPVPLSIEQIFYSSEHGVFVFLSNDGVGWENVVAELSDFFLRTTTRKRRRFLGLTMTSRKPLVTTAKEDTILSRLVTSSTTDTTSSGSSAGDTSAQSGSAGT